MSDEKFDPGMIMLTIGVSDLIEGRMEIISPLLERHLSGDWGDDVAPEDRRYNDQAVITGERVVSSYNVEIGSATVRLTIITEHDRSVTTVLLPSEC